MGTEGIHRGARTDTGGRQKISGASSSITSHKGLVFLGVGILVGGTLLALEAGWFSPKRSSTKPRTMEENWLIPVAALQKGKARHFEHETSDGTVVRFFIVRSPNGRIRAALDACEVCWPEGKGYFQEGDWMVCRNCGRRFPLEGIGEKRGGCNPHPLAPRILGEGVSIGLEQLARGAGYFRFDPRRRS